MKKYHIDHKFAWSTSRLSTRPLLFTLYMLPLGNIIRKQGVSFHCYADDTQLFISLRPGETHQIEKLMECIVDIKQWMMSQFLHFYLYLKFYHFLHSKVDLLIHKQNFTKHYFLVHFPLYNHNMLCALITNKKIAFIVRI